MIFALRIVAGIAGIAMIVAVFGSAIRTLMLPRGVSSRIARAVFLSIWKALGLRLGRAPSFERRDTVFAYLGPVYLLGLVGTWLALLWVSFAALFWMTTDASSGQDFIASASSFTTLGFDRPPGVGPELLCAFEAVLGFGLIALLISYLPTLYGAFSRRELSVNKLSMRAGSPPSGQQLLSWSWRFDRFEDLGSLWHPWEDWFAELGETHTSFPVLVSFRSPRAGQSWITAAGAVLDAASLRCAVIEAPRDINAELCIRSGYTALREIADYQGISYNSDPRPTDPIAIAREEFDAVIEVLGAAGVPLRNDREEAWRAFVGWRVNYDRILISLASVTQAPYAMWSSDRSVSKFRRPPLLFFRLHPTRRSVGPWD